MLLTHATILCFLFIYASSCHMLVFHRVYSLNLYMLDASSNFYFIISHILVARGYSALYVLT